MPLPYERHPYTAGQGVNTAKESFDLGEGELTVATGCEYHLGSQHLFKQPGRALAGTLPIATQSINAIHHLQYDTGTSKVIAYGSDGVVYESDVGRSLSFINRLGSLSGTAIPHFNAFADRWVMCNGSDDNYIREPNAPSPANAGYSGNWRKLGMQPARGKTVVAALGAGGATTRQWTDSTSTYKDADASLFASVASAYDTPVAGQSPVQGTAAVGIVSVSNSAITVPKSQMILESDATGTASSQSLQIIAAVDPELAAAGLPSNPVIRGKLKIEWVVDSALGTGVTAWVLISAFAGSSQFTNASVPIPDGTNLANIAVRITFEVDAAATWIPGATANSTCLIYDVAITGNSGATAQTSTDVVYYAVAERFTDSDGILHESPITTPSAAFTLNGQVGATITLPTQRANLASTSYVIYRSNAEPGGGYPYMWEVGTTPITSTTWQDFFVIGNPVDTLSQQGLNLLPILTVLYPTGESINVSINDPPPPSKMSVVYQGSMVYIPSTLSRKVYYSIPGTIGKAPIEQVPAVYYLEFQTHTNDQATSATVTNGGRSLIVYFPAYSMLVSYLPQANDPGVFDRRVREYVSQTRGASGTFCTTSFSMPEGHELAAAVDNLGLWVTDGVSGIKDWSVDLNWKSMMNGVDLSTGRLANNNEMFRLEFIYTDTNDDLQELHFFYGELKPNGTPKITGPHPAGDGSTVTPGWKCAHYAFADSTPKTWLGWKGSGGADGKIYIERTTTAGIDTYEDASHAYDQYGNVPFSFTTSEPYLAGLGDAVVVEQAVPQFGTSSTNTFTVIGSFKRVGSSTTVTSTKQFDTSTKAKLPWHRYCDRHKATFQDISNEQSPQFIAYEVYFRLCGQKRE